jgi:hypothetical protein
MFMDLAYTIYYGLATKNPQRHALELEHCILAYQNVSVF